MCFVLIFRLFCLFRRLPSPVLGIPCLSGRKGTQKDSPRGGEEELGVSGIGLSKHPCTVACERM